MSQSKTIIQGLEPDDNRQNPGFSNPSSNNFYSRGTGTNQSNAHKGTVVPGMMDSPYQETPPPIPNQQGPSSRKQTLAGKPIVGFLYSISRTPAGEYWPLTIGPNTIGQDPSSTVVLAEGTVSNNHAVLVIRQIKSTGSVIAAITDTQSTNGTLINGDTIGFTPVECHNGDIITVGNNYELVLILIDSAQLGLSVSKDFIHIVEDNNWEKGPNQEPNPYGQSHETILEEDFPYGGFNPSGGTSGYTPTAGTVGMDGSSVGNNHGGTIPM